MKLRPAALSDVPACQAWLEDQAARGKFLYDFHRFFARFTPGEPKAVRYRLEPLPWYEEDGPPPEQRELYGESGWDYVTDADGEFRVWRCDDPDAPELDTDPVVQSGAYDRFRRRLRWSSAAIGLLYAGLFLYLLYLFLGNSPRLLSYIRSEMPAWRIIPPALAILFSLWLVIHRYRAVRTLVRTLKAGLLMPRRAPWRRLAAMGGAGLAVYLLWLASLFVNLAVLQTQKEYPVPADLTEPAPYVSLADLSPAAGAASGGYAAAIHNWMTEEQWWIVEEGQRNGRSVSCSTRYYRLRFRSLAERLETDIQRRDEARGGSLKALGDSRFDGAFWGTDPSDGSQILLLRRGRQVLEAEYRGPGELREQLDGLQAVLNRFAPARP